MKKKILVVDPDPLFYEKLKEDPHAKDVPLEVVSTGAEAQKILKEQKGDFIGCIISPEVRDPNGAAVARFSLTYQPSVPIYLLETMNLELDDTIDMERMGVAGKIAKPFNLKSLKDALGNAIDIFDQEDILKVSQANTDKVGEETQNKESEFRPIKAELFVSGAKSLFDIYVKLRAEKFIKIVQAGDTFDVDRVVEFLKKGVQYFYIRKEAQEAYIQYCDKLTGVIARSPNLASDKKVGFLFNQAEVTVNALAEMGVDNDSLVYAQKYFKNSCAMLSTLSKESDFLTKLLKEMALFEHSGAVVMVATIVAKFAGIETEKSLEALGLAALLHDIELKATVSDGGIYSDEVEKLFNENDVADKVTSKKVYGDEKNLLEDMFHRHAERAANKLATLKEIPTIVPQIVRQHHAQLEKREGRYKGGQVHALAEIIEISDTFVRAMAKFMDKEAKVDKQALMSSMIEEVSSFPRRTREPFMIAFKFSK